jgi:hypothetical protein
VLGGTRQSPERAGDSFAAVGRVIGALVRNPHDSWWLKLNRAEKHLTEFKDYVSEFSKTRPYTVTRDVETDSDPGHYLFRAWLKDPVDFQPSIIIGDFIHNVRSALDHVLVASRLPKYRWKPGFPILTEDPWQRDRETGRFLKKFRDDRDRFEAATQGLPDLTRTFIQGIQPYHRDGPDDPLAIVSRLDNADKHRELVVVTQHLRSPAITLHTRVRGEPGPMFHQSGHGETFENGAIIALFPFPEPIGMDYDVHSHGAVEVALKRGEPWGGYYELPSTLETILKYVSEDVVLTLDTFTSS